MVEAVKPNDPDKGWGRPPPDQADWVYCTADEGKLDYNLVISLDEKAAYNRHPQVINGELGGYGIDPTDPTKGTTLVDGGYPFGGASYTLDGAQYPYLSTNENLVAVDLAGITHVTKITATDWKGELDYVQVNGNQWKSAADGLTPRNPSKLASISAPDLVSADTIWVRAVAPIASTHTIPRCMTLMSCICFNVAKLSP